MFERFVSGLLARMGKDVKSNMGLCHKVLLAIVKTIEDDLSKEVLSYKSKTTYLICVTVVL